LLLFLARIPKGILMDGVRLSFLRHLIATPGPSGFEQPVQRVIREAVEPYSDEVRSDIHGNLIAALNAAGKPRVMLTAHCDEPGFLIRYSDELGFLYFSPIGAHDPASLKDMEQASEIIARFVLALDENVDLIP
jgi:putative aminopeptidase FrvX